jgi:two-component system chemotaxis response regulator CheY
MKKLIRFFVDTWHSLRGKEEDGPRLPSFVKALSVVAPRSVLREVMASQTDRRQWGIVAAGWVGVSEKEFMRAIARELKLPFEERLPTIDPALLGSEPEKVLSALRDAGASVKMEGASISGFIAVDPAEVRGLAMYDGTQELAIGAWTEISRTLEIAEKKLQEVEQVKSQQAASHRDDLCGRVIELILQEVSAHSAQALDIIVREGRARYQFVSSSGEYGFGNIHQSVVHDLVDYLLRFQTTPFKSPSKGSILVRALAGREMVRLAWGSEYNREMSEPKGGDVEVNALQQRLLPSPADSELTVASDAQASSPMLPTAPDQRVAPKGEIIPRSQSQHPRDKEPGGSYFNPSTAGLPVLVVDDNPMFCRVLERLLKRDGYEPSFAENGAAAWEKLQAMREQLPHAIICDLHMPLMNGEELLGRIKRDDRYKNIPVVMLTSDDGIDSELTLLGNGADAFVSKAKDPRVLVAQVRRLTARGGSTGTNTDKPKKREAA